MKIESKIFDNESDWLAFRKNYVSSTETPALFDKGKWLTYFKLWHLKKGTLDDDFKENQKTRAGKKMEDVIAEIYSEQTGRHVEDFPEYRYSSEYGLGSSYDKITIDEEASKHILEIKNLEWRTIADWEDGEPDYQYLIQCQTQLGLYPEAKTAILCCLVNGWDLKTFTIERDDAFIEALKSKCKKFWESIAACNEPDFDLESAETAKSVYTDWVDTTAIATNEIEKLANDLFVMNQNISENTKLKDSIKEKLLSMLDVELLVYQLERCNEQLTLDIQEKDFIQAQLMRMSEAGTVLLSNGQKLDMKFQNDTPATVITADMVGKTYGGRKGYRRCQIRGKAK